MSVDFSKNNHGERGVSRKKKILNIIRTPCLSVVKKSGKCIKEAA
jgi:hypothetical protein